MKKETIVIGNSNDIVTINRENGVSKIGEPNEHFEKWCKFLMAETNEEREKIAKGTPILEEALESIYEFQRRDYVQEYCKARDKVEKEISELREQKLKPIEMKFAESLLRDGHEPENVANMCYLDISEIKELADKIQNK